MSCRSFLHLDNMVDGAGTSLVRAWPMARLSRELSVSPENSWRRRGFRPRNTPLNLRATARAQMHDFRRPASLQFGGGGRKDQESTCHNPRQPLALVSSEAKHYPTSLRSILSRSCLRSSNFWTFPDRDFAEIQSRILLTQGTFAWPARPSPGMRASRRGRV